MWEYRLFNKLDFRTVPIILAIMAISLLIIGSTTMAADQESVSLLQLPFVRNQCKWFGIGFLFYAFFAGLDYHKLRQFAWIGYVLILFLLLGLFFTTSIRHVHRWYQLPVLGIMFQPSDFAKLMMVITLSSFLEREGLNVSSKKTFFMALFLFFIPFMLILKQPDLGSALVLMAMTIGMLYFGGANPFLVKTMSIGVSLVLSISVMVFLGILPYQQMSALGSKVLKSYQIERFNPSSYHHESAKTSLALGKIKGSGWGKSIYMGRKYLPAAHTDSVFPAFVEEFGLMGAFFMLLLLFSLIYCSFQTTAVAKDHFGQVLAAGISVYLTVHVIINIGMMCGFLPITGVPLLLVSYGGSSVVCTMSALGILQSIYIRRFMF
ncbi:rod shape-determining protein RodA [Candidatus Aerophobetes bacterium]|uniref:Rod shape-determining protein RodA n=1 Tax=Aerophobetes bacterium TaxID=2030807 RepID=A0A2A4X143_UNCAE|nr:MAG: rod shape-determining protein RodA [Candidatus Aerophobetes bacterium]